MSQQSYNTDGINEQGPQLLNYRSSLIICRPPESCFEAAEFGGAVAVLHIGNVLRQVLRPFESTVGLLGRMGMSVAPREIVDHRDRA